MAQGTQRKFSPEAQKEVDKILFSYGVKESAVLPVLHVAQREFGCLDRAAVELVASTLGLSPTRVAQTASFYTMFSPAPLGKHVIQVCTNVSCSLLGSEGIVRYLEKRLGVERGHTRPDGLVTLSTVECLGSCGTAPVMAVNDRYFENLTTEKVESILRELGL
ncbi:MAG: NAD(P)H-dependent oxidoreductase subunit E [Candidatus Eisenbacteria bacterium]|nr:NAD(P)H-dependent oxidoreductase subunit E [Candidatus Eisenbacteria bacterium]